ncbi:MAG: class I SAM-dependent methyltransferase [Rhodoglobus sp.]|tara:strand:- start:5978 stop:6847 length:870 start_codon:yes stop_codon:yes gene_type:complete
MTEITPSHTSRDTQQSPQYVMDNLASWNERAPVHANSPDYAVDKFVTDPDFLSDVVRFDMPLLGDIAGLRGIHLQCHIGTDTVSLERLGASMTGLDFSSASLAEARRLAERSNAATTFVEAEVYDAPAALDGQKFDLVYTGIGAICWLPSIDRWARTVAALLHVGGRLFIREGHPMLYALDDENPDAFVVRYPYFEQPDALIWEDAGTYVETDHVFTATTGHEWSHGLGETITALLDHGMRIDGLVEHQSLPWNALPGQMKRGEDGEYRLTHGAEQVPLTYTLQATRIR